jgi:hypothetical protein
MKNVKVKSGYYLDNFSSTSLDIVWSKIAEIIKQNQKNFSSVNVDKENNQIIVSFVDEADIINMIKTIDKNSLLNQNLRRQIRLNLTFNKEGKNLILSTENTDKFEKFNEVCYEIDCANVKNENSLYFHESSLVDYTEKNLISELKNCPFKLVLVSYNENVSTCVYHDDKEPTEMTKNTTKYMYLCIDTSNDKLIENEFSTLNKDEKIKILDFINVYNNDLYENDCFNYEDFENESIAISYKFSDFKMTVSDFVLPEQKEDEFLRFKSFVSYFIYDTFLTKLINDLENIW